VAGRAARRPAVRRRGWPALALAAALIAPAAGLAQGGAPTRAEPPGAATGGPGASTGGTDPTLPAMPRVEGEPAPDPTGSPTGTAATRPGLPPGAEAESPASSTLAPTPSTRPLAPLESPMPRPGATSIR